MRIGNNSVVHNIFVNIKNLPRGNNSVVYNSFVNIKNISNFYVIAYIVSQIYCRYNNTNYVGICCMQIQQPS